MNMEGNMDYAMLKAIENGASPYFILSYRNTQNLKENNSFSKYYSVRYDIWKDDLIDTYNKLNDALYDVQDKFIISHDKVEGALRVPDLDEIEADLLEKLKEYAYSQEHAEQIKNEQARFEVSIARDTCRMLLEDAIETYDIIWSIYDAIISGNSGSGVTTLKDVTKRYENYKKALDDLAKVEEYKQYENSTNEDEIKLYEKYTKALAKVDETLNSYLIPFTRMFKDQEVFVINGVSYKAKDINNLIEKMYDKLELAAEYIEIIAKFEGYEITYEEGKEGDVMAILNVDSLPRFTKKAVEQAQSAYINMQSDKFVDSTVTVEHDGDSMQQFPVYDENGKIPSVTDKVSYKVLYDDGVDYDDEGNDISELDIAYTGKNVSEYRYYVIVNVDKNHKVYDENGGESGPIRYEGAYVILVPFVAEKIEGTNIYKDLGNDGSWIYYELDAENNRTYYLPVNGGGFTKITPEEYLGSAVSTSKDKIYVLRNAEGQLLTDKEGATIYVSGTDHNNYHTYILTGSVEKMREEYNAGIDKIVKDTAALGQITEEEFREILAKTDIVADDDDDSDDTQENKYATGGVIAVTYGTLEGEAYKTMLLNYNNYAVNITYNGKSYTIPAYDFVVIKI